MRKAGMVKAISMQDNEQGLVCTTTRLPWDQNFLWNSSHWRTEYNGQLKLIEVKLVICYSLLIILISKLVKYLTGFKPF